MTAAVAVGCFGAVSASSLDNHQHKHTVSGFSSGADMAIMHTVAFSSYVTGVGIVGGAPYGCQLLPDAGDACGAMADNATLPWDQYVDDEFFQYLVQRAEDGLIDPLESLRGTNVYLYSGLFDTCVYRDVMKAVERQLRNLTKLWDDNTDTLGDFPTQAFKTVYDIPSEHAWIVDDFVCNRPGHSFHIPYYCGDKPQDPPQTTLPFVSSNDDPSEPDPIFTHGCCAVCDAGGQCNGRNPPINITAPWWRPPINHCGYDMSGEMFEAVVGGGKPLSKKREYAHDSHLYQFNQSRYTQNGTDRSAWNSAMAPEAFIYVPEECHHNHGSGNHKHKCDVHVHYHCCAGSYNTEKIGRNLMLKQGIIEWAEPNNIIVLYPQTSRKGVQGWYVDMLLLLFPALPRSRRIHVFGAVRLNRGCWDWYGDDHGGGALFDTQLGRQLRTVINMVEDLDHIIKEVTHHKP